MSAETFRPEDGDTVAGLAKLAPIEYDKAREEQAREMGIRVSTLDSAVAEYRESQQEENTDDVVESLEKWNEPVDGAAFADEVADILRRHVVLPDGARTAITLWCLGTFTMPAWRLWPKLLITSPEKRCGKSTLLEAIEAMTASPLLTANISPSALFRCIEEWKPTLLIDEADTFTKDDDSLNGIINCGHTRRTAVVIRSEKDGESFKPKKFSVWAPMVLAGIKNQRDTLHDRSVHIELRRRMAGEKCEKLPGDYFEQQTRIRRQGIRWALDENTRLKQPFPEMPSCGNDRASDNWQPLFTIASVLGGAWPERVRASFTVLEQGGEREDTAGVMLLEDIRQIFEAHIGPHISSKKLVDELIAKPDRPWCEWRHGKPLTQNSLSRLLKHFQISSTNIRVGDKVPKGYKRKQFEDAFARYLPCTPISTATPLQASEGAGFSENQTATRGSNVAVKKPLKASQGGDCSGVAFQNGVHGSEEGSDYPPGLFDAATTACGGLKISAGEFISELETADYPEIISNPELAKVAAKSMNSRR